MRASPLCALVAALVAGGLASACGGSGYQYVENEDLGVYARLPGDWEIFDESDLFPDDSDAELDRRNQSMWVRTFDASSDPDVEDWQAPGGGSPRGIVQVVTLNADARNQLNISMMRGLGDPSQDPVARADQSTDVQVLVDETAEFDGGYHGVHIVFAQQPPTGGDPVVFDRTVLVDSATTTLFLFQVACEEQCYLETHQDEIADLVDSWTIEEDQG
jgi:hypothetical protein